jgi:hypothetical protein
MVKTLFVGYAKNLPWYQMLQMKNKINAVMNVEKGEEIAATLISGHISGTGYYKFLAKKRKDGIYEWAHFTERENGLKENIYRGETKNSDELDLVVEIMNRNLKKVFGEHAEMKQAFPEFRSLNGDKLDDAIN